MKPKKHFNPISRNFAITLQKHVGKKISMFKVMYYGQNYWTDYKFQNQREIDLDNARRIIIVFKTHNPVFAKESSHQNIYFKK